MIVVIDNYDSFVFNIVQELAQIDQVQVFRNDAATTAEILALKPGSIVLSPGPGRPKDAGICREIVQSLAENHAHPPILGICLGHQVICESFGGTVSYAKQTLHGKQTPIRIHSPNTGIFTGLPAEVSVGRYHSLAVAPESVPDCLQVTATARDGEIMAVQHRELPITGLQFHPESILTPQGSIMLRNHLKEQK